MSQHFYQLHPAHMGRYVIRYYAGSLTHGLLHSLVLQPGEWRRQLLVTEHLGWIAMNTAINPLVCPITLAMDIVGFEAWARGIDTHLHKPKLFFERRDCPQASLRAKFEAFYDCVFS
jgi:hypothetical protein